MTIQNNFSKFKLMLWKNFIIRKRHYVYTLLEILMAVLIFSLLTVIRVYSPEVNVIYVNSTEYRDIRQILPRNVDLMYAPNTPFVNQLMDKARERVRTKSFHGFASEYAMMTYYTSLNSSEIEKNSMVGVVFENFPKDKFPKELKYRIRTDIGSDFSRLFDHNSDPFFSSEKMRYFEVPFIDIQHAIDMSFIVETSNSTPNVEITLQEMPYPPHEIFGQFKSLHTFYLPFATILSFLIMFLCILKSVIEEKSSGIKELMKMMGLKPWMLWLGWFINSIITTAIAITVIVILLTMSFKEGISPFIIDTSKSVLWVFFFLYCISGICFSFALSTIFKKPTMGMCVGLLIWIITFFAVKPVVENDNPNIMKMARCITSLIPNTLLLYGYRAISESETHHMSLNWGHLFTSPNRFTPHPTMGTVFILFIFDSILFCIFTWYFDNVFPGQFGISRPWYFPFTKSYWARNRVDQGDDSLGPCDEQESVENVSKDLEPGVQIRNLHKSFGGKMAVNGLNMDIYSNQITALLGHNGAGKTTTMHIITGMLPATSGTVIVNGFNMKHKINSVRESLGLCPQHNLQFSDLTVLEHLIFFARLKGLPKSTALLESKDFLARLNLTSKANQLASSLSGGMKRKLSLGMAIVGHTKVLILDEPTSGLDPEARREIWDFLLSMRGQRTIVITTHFMEEADVLGDRIAIMHNGQLQCYGTAMFLKKHYGTGYVLSILVRPNWDINVITKAVQDNIKSATVKSFAAGCVTFLLPTNNTNALTKLFAKLEENKTELLISSFGVSLTSLEDVFLRVGELAEEKDKKASISSDTDSSKYLLGDSHPELLDGERITSEFGLLCQQFRGLFIKRLQYSRHKWLMFHVQMLIPLGMLLFIMSIMKLDTSIHDTNVNQELVLTPYIKPEVFYSTAPEMKDFGAYFENTVERQKASAIHVPQVSNAILSVGEKDMTQYHRTLIAAAEFNYTNDKMHLNGMFGNWALHGPPISLNLLTNTLLKYIMKSDSFSISVANKPLPYVEHQDININVVAILMWFFLFPIAFSVMIGFFLVFLHEERQTGARHLQIMAGVPKILYWLVQYVYDMIVYMFVLVVILVILVAFDSDGPFGNQLSLGAIFCLLFFFGLAVLPFAYLFTFCGSPSSGIIILTSIQVVFGTIATIIVVVLETLGPETQKAYQITLHILYFLPNFNFSYGMYRFTRKASTAYKLLFTEECETDPETNPCCVPDSAACLDNTHFFRGEFSLRDNIIFLAADAAIYFSILLFLNSGILNKFFELLWIKYRINDISDENLDDDVQEEKRRIKEQIEGTTGTDALEVYNLRKWFWKFYAVRGLNFGVKPGECFGLLGVNGAGKTTTFRMLTGDIAPSSGGAKLLGFSLRNNKTAYFRNIGYCPQFDALNFTLTAREMLTLFARLRGIPNQKVDAHVNKWIYKSGLTRYENIPCGDYSGGNKRKLSTAIALIGEPPLVMLDEPTSGVDPIARRNIWEILALVRKAGQSIVLTSHSMDECEALCERLAIMVDGQMKCIGNVQYLKNKFGQGFTVRLKLRSVTTSAGGDSTDGSCDVYSIKQSIEERYNCTLKDEYTGMLVYHVVSPNVTLAQIFNFMENLKNSKTLLEDYTVSDTSLEQVFLSFAKKKEKFENENKSNLASPSTSATRRPVIAEIV